MNLALLFPFLPTPVIPLFLWLLHIESLSGLLNQISDPPESCVIQSWTPQHHP